MQLFTGSSDLFIEKAISNEIAPTLAANFRRYLGYRPGESEIRSWTNSLKDLAFSLDRGALHQSGIVVEYRLPMSSKRLDAMIIGPGLDAQERAVIVELKQWDRAYSCGIDDCVSFTKKNPTEFHLHPSRQAGSYAEYLRETHTAFYSDSGGQFVDLQACSFLHDANSRTCGDLFADEFADTVSRYPLFTGDRRDELETYLGQSVGQGDGRPVLQKVLESYYLPSKKLMEHVAEMIEGNPTFVLLDDQLKAFNIVMSELRSLQLSSSKAVVLVIGGPGTGKSVIAVRLLADLAKQGRNVVHCTGSKAFTTNLRAQVGSKASVVFKYFNSFVETPADSLDVVIADEAHRIRKSSNDRFRRKSTKDQVFELLDSAKVSVFLLDHNQVVRPGEVGTPDLIRDAAKAAGAKLFEVELRGQFRCSGSESYLRWLDWVFDLGGDADLTWLADYDFRICDSPAELEGLVRGKVSEGATARLVAGFCWPWSDPQSDGSLVDDVVVGPWARPWNRRAKSQLPPAKDPYFIWATQPTGLGEVGCIYSAQGFEFDYCGVIFGRDLLRREDGWHADSKASYDRVVTRAEDLVDLLCNTYRVLMSRGMKGTYLYFQDPQTRAFFENMLTQARDEFGVSGAAFPLAKPSEH